MRFKLLVLLGFCCLTGLAFAEMDAKERDRQAILAMAGTFVVDFHFEETVGFQLGYEIKEPYDSQALETIIVVEDSADRIVLQHVLQTKRGIIKHWRQDWLFENRALWEFQGHKTWEKRTLSEAEAAGTWTQRVFQVDDSPRYEAIGRWTHIGDLSQWESEPTNRPLPRREYTKRDDYHIMVARNRQTLTQTGWVHEQDNYKLRLADDEQPETVIARELGLNTYSHTRADRCADARAWWQEHKAFWAEVRSAWQARFKQHSRIQLKAEVDDSPLYRHMFALADEFGGDQFDAKSAREEIEATLDDFFMDATKVDGPLASNAY